MVFNIPLVLIEMMPKCDFKENGKIDVLTSMKCLDEGVDVPRSESAHLKYG
jgi:hypothetical protein